MDGTSDLVLAVFLVFILLLVYIIIRMFINLMKDRDVLKGLSIGRKRLTALGGRSDTLSFFIYFH